jgi:5-methylcytosine-specific restriction enzyme A
MAVWPYTTARWQRLRRAKLRRVPMCEYCAPRVTAATDVDHRQAIRDGGDPWAWENLSSACHECHSRKTRYSEQLGMPVPVKGCDPATGLPLDPRHWWAGSANCSGLGVADRPCSFKRT